ncbi:MAG: PorV/PorQ family protein [Bacteroidia bacterium]|nr:PorV/PorQ family protein [Bacteroidia bacterium]MBP7260281.1 PorV/PorQ family protein [Bacteroidia bacterium]MBP9179330.1 PorV/PorQ family protein [Bacteroidia bacterium]MBP9724852.1 PorV/PorQ family protein [Bacteroidia bacterium]
MKLIQRWLFSLALLSGLSASAQKYSNEFMMIGVGGRSFGMSNSVVASVNDVTAGYWNPSGLLNLKDNLQVSLMHSEYFAGIANYDYGAIAFKMGDKSAGGVSIIRFGVDDIANTIDLFKGGQINYNNIKSFSVVDYGFLFSYARKTKINGLNLGGNAKIIRRRAGDFANAWGFGLDFGAQYDYKKWKFGAMFRDVTSTFNAWSYNLTPEEKQVFQQTGNTIPVNTLEITTPRFILGAARQFTLYKKITCMPEVNMTLTTDGQRNVLVSSKTINLDPTLGVEFGYSDFIFLRTGVGNFQKEKDNFSGKQRTTFQPNIGVGLRMKSFTIDYALSDIGDQSAALYSNVFSLKLAINKRKAAEVPAAQ